MDWLAEMYITLLPGMAAGVLNMVWCKALRFPAPIDGGRNWCDGRRVFGDNKTWKGLIGMVVLGCACSAAWGAACAANGYLGQHNYFYQGPFSNTFAYNAGVGAAIGLAYAVFELPNSFLKRRLAVEPGKPAPRAWRILFTCLDQADSVVGMVFVVSVFHPLSLGYFWAYVAVGSATHAVLNVLLFLAGLRRQPL
ncbi:MAG: CDP-archaeol synthase [Propionibacteriaceae bacterium]|jgi:CDP-diglyceride synthetase|nr:CDP-archaeol synthase [Propionibacteriaceae bacterium]